MYNIMIICEKNTGYFELSITVFQGSEGFNKLLKWRYKIVDNVRFSALDCSIMNMYIRESET